MRPGVPLSVVPAATAISDLATPGQADEDVVAMAFDPELATPHAEVISDEILQPPNPTFAENLEMSPPAADVWRERGEPLASAVSDTDEQPGQGWDEPARNQTEIASEGRIWEPQRELGATQHVWLMPKSERRGAGRSWFRIVLPQLHNNYRVIWQSAALISVGAVAALLVVGFSHRRSPLPDALRGTGGLRQETPQAKSRQKLPPRLATKRSVGKSEVAPKKAVELKSAKPAARAQIVPGKVNLASSHQVLSKSPERSGMDMEKGFVAKDTVTHYGNYPATGPPK
ncbi:MAG: hypothetical protein DMG61_23530 [Acidobacteria bacterium]|nr:MAG: hypothetical protein DMG61_23530 [Acidobacteriota bacterium]